MSPNLFSSLARAAALALVFALPAGFAAESRNLISNAELRPDAAGAPAEWTIFSPRPDLAPEHGLVQRGGAGALMLRARGFESYGHWSTRVRGVTPGQHYRFEALHQTDGVAPDSGSVFAVVSWYGGTFDSPRELQRDYIDQQEQAGEWVRMARTLQAPAGAAFARVELGLRRAPSGAVFWREPSFAEVPPPAPRRVRVATTRILPTFPATVAENTKLMADMFDRVGAEKPDIVLFSENLNTRGVKAPRSERAQTIPGPLTDMLAEKARRFGTYVITTLLERDGERYHNTAVLIDRAGRIVGKYRKVHLTISEMENGLTPGSDYPVFDTELGRIGIVTCWDNWFSEPMRILRLRGAEMVFMPLAGDGDPGHWEPVWKARAIDNGVYLVTSSTVTDAPSRIIDPNGRVVADATDKFGHVIAELDLNREWRLRYLSIANGTGEGRSLYLRERRPETYAPLLKDEPVRPAPVRNGM